MNIVLDKPVNVSQLATEVALAMEVNDPIAFVLMESDLVRELTWYDEAVTVEIVETALANHVPAPPPPSPTRLLQDQIDALADLILMGGM